MRCDARSRRSRSGARACGGVLLLRPTPACHRRLRAQRRWLLDVVGGGQRRGRRRRRQRIVQRRFGSGRVAVHPVRRSALLHGSHGLLQRRDVRELAQLRASVRRRQLVLHELSAGVCRRASDVQRPRVLPRRIVPGLRRSGDRRSMRGRLRRRALVRRRGVVFEGVYDERRVRGRGAQRHQRDRSAERVPHGRGRRGRVRPRLRVRRRLRQLRRHILLLDDGDRRDRGPSLLPRRRRQPLRARGRACAYY